jgi:hypothetical protein
VLLACSALLGLLAVPRAEAATDLAGPAMQDAALALEARILDHLHYGQIYEQHYRTAARVAGDIATTVGEDDSALYTGNYLASQAFRYALAKRKIAEGDNVAFWTGQRDEALARVDAITRQYHILTNISAYWNTTFNPQLHNDRPLTRGRIDFGGGVFPAKKGLLFRSCTPADAPQFVNQGAKGGNRVFGPFNWPGDQYVPANVYYCRDATSRDAYAGTTFGLLTAFDLVAADNPAVNPAMRAMIRDDILALSDYTLSYLWSTPRMHGRVVIPEVEGGNDLDNFWSPLFMYTPVQQLNMAGIARHVARSAGTTAQKLKWNTVWLAEVATQGPNLLEETLLNAAQPHDSYYKFHLDYMALFNLIRTEANATVREQLMKRALGIMDATTGDDGNALYDAFVYAVSGAPSRLANGVVASKEWLEYRKRLDLNGNVTVNSNRCVVEIECESRGTTEVLVGGVPVLTIPPVPASTETAARFPIEIRNRRGQDFLWQKDPTLLDESPGATWEATGADFLLPYWMLRYYSETSPLSSKPLPVWPGPAFR